MTLALSAKLAVADPKPLHVRDAIRSPTVPPTHDSVRPL